MEECKVKGVAKLSNILLMDNLKPCGKLKILTLIDILYFIVAVGGESHKQWSMQFLMELLILAYILMDGFNGVFKILHPFNKII